MSQYKDNSGKKKTPFFKGINLQQNWAQDRQRTASTGWGKWRQESNTVHTKCEMAAPGVLSTGERKRKTRSS